MRAYRVRAGARESAAMRELPRPDAPRCGQLWPGDWYRGVPVVGVPWSADGFAASFWWICDGAAYVWSGAFEGRP